MHTHAPEMHDIRKPVETLTLWSQLLRGLLEENTALKTSLADAIRGCAACEQLDRLEDFQTRFIAKDAVIALLRRDLAEIVSAARNEELLTPEQSAASVKLGRDMLRMKEEIRGMKAEFVAYVQGMERQSGNTL